jgi:hypothetical protein
VNAVLLGDDQRHLQNIDGIQSQALSVQGRIGIDILRLHLKIQSLHEQRSKFPL